MRRRTALALIFTGGTAAIATQALSTAAHQTGLAQGSDAERNFAQR
ncbi:MAG: hypothetical protein JO352_32220 [Chloroflexi bacterium]|nr:hypothetical protein [Chloroflexota bacterium]